MELEQQKALDYIQQTISSMRAASFKCKELSIIICSAFISIFAAVNPTPNLMILLCAPVLLVFWILDASYLSVEKMFRNEYYRISKLTDDDLKNINPLLFTSKIGLKKRSAIFIKSMFASFSTTLFYGVFVY